LVEVEMYLGGGGLAVKAVPADNDCLRRAAAKQLPPAGAASPRAGPQLVPAAMPATNPVLVRANSPGKLQQRLPASLPVPGPRVVLASTSSPRLTPAALQALPTAAPSAGGDGARVNVQEGTNVEVWSKEHKVWCPGKVRQVLNGSIVVGVLQPNGSSATKALPLDSKELRVAAASLQVDTPLSTMHSVREPSYTEYAVGDEVQVWSNSFFSWCDGKVIGVEGVLVHTEFVLPNGHDARKSLAASQGGIRRPLAGRSPRRAAGGGDAPAAVGQMVQKVSEDASHIEMDYHGELGLLGLEQHRKEPYAVGDNVEVWSNSSKAWCVGKVVAVQTGLVHTNFTLPSGAIAKKCLPLDDAGLRALGTVLQQFAAQSRS